jgi:hypothetical protein
VIRRKPLKRSTKPIARRKRIPCKRAKPRRGPLRDPGYLDFLRKECATVVALGFTGRHTVGRCDAAHGPANGRGSKGPDNEALPLTREQHEEQTKIGHAAFAAKYGFDWRHEAAAHYKAYQIWKESTNVIAE